MLSSFCASSSLHNSAASGAGFASCGRDGRGANKRPQSMNAPTLRITMVMAPPGVGGADLYHRRGTASIICSADEKRILFFGAPRAAAGCWSTLAEGAEGRKQALHDGVRLPRGPHHGLFDDRHRAVDTRRQVADQLFGALRLRRGD